MYKWIKLGRVFHPNMVENIWWMKEFAQTPSVLIFNDFVRVYFCTRPNVDDKGLYVSYLGYIELDNNDLLSIREISPNPVLSLGDVGTFDEFGIYPASVVKIKEDVRVYYGGNTRCVSVPFNAAIGVAISSNEGLTFQRVGLGPVLSYSLDEPFVLGSPKIRFFNGKWFLWYSAGQKWHEKEGNKQPIYKIRCATSSDGINWNKLGKNILPSILEEDECQASADVICRSGRYHMFFSYRYNFGYKEPGRGYRIGYAVSDNLLDWERDDKKAGLFPSDHGWDSESVSYAHLFEHKERVYALYQGNYMGKEGFGLAILEGEL